MTQQQQHQSAICSPESIQPILGWKQSAISEETRRCKWWVVSGDVKCLDYVNLISWYHDPEGQGFILEIIIEIRTWHVVVRCRLIVFYLTYFCRVELSYVFAFTWNILTLAQTHWWLMVGHYERSLWEDGKCINISIRFSYGGDHKSRRRRIFKTMSSFTVQSSTAELHRQK